MLRTGKSDMCKEESAMLRSTLSMILGLGICKYKVFLASEMSSAVLLSEP